MIFGWLCENVLHSSEDWSYAWKCGNGQHCRLYYFVWDGCPVRELQRERAHANASATTS